MRQSDDSSKGSNAVEIAQLVVRYGSRTVLHEVDFKARRGDINVVIGGSGSGKSTLLRHALGLEQPESGTVRLLDCDIDSVTEEELKRLRTRIGVLFQNGALFTSMTVGENVGLVIRENTDLPEEIIKEMVHMKLALVGLEDAAKLYPEHLSGGMRKRAALARAIATDPEMLFCDEPSAGLDPVVASELDDLLLKLKSYFDMTMVVVTHDIESIKKIADQVAMLHRGEMIARGTLKEVTQGEDPRVHDFFHRISHAGEKARASNTAPGRGEKR